MATFFSNAAIIQHQNPIHLGDCGQAMRDGDDGFALHHPVKRVLDRRLDLAVERAGGLIKDQNRCVFQDHPRQGDPLTLPAGEFHATLAHLRVIAQATFRVGEIENELMRLGPVRRCDHLRLARLGPPVKDVLSDRPMQK